MKDFLKNKNRCIVIPCFNEARTLPEVIRGCQSAGAQVIVVDDGSTDASTHNLPYAESIIVLTHPINAGKGKALDTGIRYAIASEYEYCITLDADLQHPPELAVLFFEELTSRDIVLGTRKRTGSEMPLQRRLSNFLTTLILQLKTGVNFRDSQCGYRGYRLSAIADILPDMAGFMAETEILILAARKKLRTGFVEIPVIYGDTDSKMRPIESIIAFIKLIVSK